MESGDQRPLVGWDIHGFHTLEDLDIVKTKEEAATRWLRPNEIFAILCNYTYFNINVKPVELPESGTIILYDRKMLRNFRKDGHNWKKKNDGKTVKEAHEHLKVGCSDRIHVYYAHGQDNNNFVRRIYWLLDKKLEHIVLVHYREENMTSDVMTPKDCKEALSLSNRMHHVSPITPVHSHSGSQRSETSGSRVTSEEYDSEINQAFYAGTANMNELTGFGKHLDKGLTLSDHEQSFHDFNTLEWADILEANDEMPSFDQQRHHGVGGDCGNQDQLFQSHNVCAFENPSVANNCSYFMPDQPSNGYSHPHGGQNFQPPLFETMDAGLEKRDFETDVLGTVETSEIFEKDPLQSQDSFTRWIDIIGNDSGSVIDLTMECTIPNMDLGATVIEDGSPLGEVFRITEIAPTWALAVEETKVLVTGYFHERSASLAKSELFCVIGDVCVPAEVVQDGVLRCKALPCSPGLVDFYLSLDGKAPISQILSFEFRSVPTSQLHNDMGFLEDDDSKWREFQLQIRLAHLLFSTTNGLINLPCNLPPKALKEAKTIAAVVPSFENDWMRFVNLIMKKEMSYAQGNQFFFELALKNKLNEWLLERVAEGRKTTPRDSQGQGVIHLCAMLDYTWAVPLFSLSGLSLDFRDSNGWTALHWAAYYGREKMVATLLSHGANPSLVTHPTSKNLDGSTAADVAAMKGYDGLAAYLAQMGLLAHYNAMCKSGNASGPLQISNSIEQSDNLNEEDQLLKDSLAAYRSAADAAARIHTAMREHALKVKTKAVQSENTEVEARKIISAMKIQHAYRNFHSRKQMVAAIRIQHRFRTWRMRKDFLNMRRQAIRIQAAFRGHLVRRQYHKIVWSVGVLEKAILRWRQRRKGLRGLQVETPMSVADQDGIEDGVQEDFYQASRKQAEDRVERAIVRVQTMFRSHQAQKEYRRMKLVFDQAKSEFEKNLGSAQQQWSSPTIN